MRYATPMRRGGPALEDALGQVPGLLFIPEDVAPRAPGGADAAVGDFHHPDTEEIGAGLHPVVPGAVAGGISGFEGDAEVKHGRGKENVGFLYGWRAEGCSSRPAARAAHRVADRERAHRRLDRGALVTLAGGDRNGHG